MPRGQPPPERDGHRYPLFRTNNRVLPRDYGGPLCLWDIDNTYLLTEWSSLRDLIRIRFEAAIDKRPIPGAVALLRALRRGGGAPLRSPLYFVSASPETMRTVLEKRMLLDGVEHDGATFRDLWTGAGRPHLRHIRDVYGYKVAALILYRHENPPRAREVLFGDDREHDPEVYALYARVCAGKLRGEALEQILVARGVLKPDARYIRQLGDALPESDPVERIVIRHLEGKSRVAEGLPAAPPFDAKDERVLVVDDYGQAAAALRAMGTIDADGLAEVLADVRAEGLGGGLDHALQAVSARARPGAVERVRVEVSLLEPGRTRAPEPYGPPRPAPGSEPVSPVTPELIAEARALEAAAADAEEDDAVEAGGVT